MSHLSTGRDRCTTSAAPAVFTQDPLSGFLSDFSQVLISQLNGCLRQVQQGIHVLRSRFTILGFPPLGLGNRGSMLLETAVAVLVFGIVGTAVMVGIRAAHSSGELIENRATAEVIARNQMENVFNQAYLPPPASYPSIIVAPMYTVSANASEYVSGDTNIEKLTVLVTYDGRNLLALETLRAGP